MMAVFQQVPYYVGGAESQDEVATNAPNPTR